MNPNLLQQLEKTPIIFNGIFTAIETFTPAEQPAVNVTVTDSHNNRVILFTMLYTTYQSYVGNNEALVNKLNEAMRNNRERYQIPYPLTGHLTLNVAGAS